MKLGLLSGSWIEVIFWPQLPELLDQSHEWPWLTFQNLFVNYMSLGMVEV